MGDRVAVMRDGRLEQVDTPQGLYDRPANLFVAAFIGSPAMNLVRGRLAAEEDGLALWLGAHRIALPAARLELHARAGEDVIVGIRPEALDHARHAAPGGAVLELPVVLTEALGSDTLVHLELEAAGVVAPDVAIELAAAGIDAGPGTALAERATTVICARLPPHTAAVAGRVATVRVDAGGLHFFDPETELAHLARLPAVTTLSWDAVLAWRLRRQHLAERAPRAAALDVVSASAACTRRSRRRPS